jgi:hypothetical protein
MYFTASEIGDYEVRRELKRRNRIGNIQKLEALREEVDFLPLTHQVMLKASEVRIQVRATSIRGFRLRS